MERSHQCSFNGVVLLKIDWTIHKILFFEWFFIIISVTASLIFKRTTPLKLHWWDLFIDSLNLKISAEIKKWPLILQKWHFSKINKKIQGVKNLLHYVVYQFLSMFSSMGAKVHLQSVQNWNLTTLQSKVKHNFHKI